MSSAPLPSVPAVPVVALPGGGQMPQVGFGTWRLRGSQAAAAVRAALDAGYRHIDTATMYSNEADIGQALASSGVARSDVFLTTKIMPSDQGRETGILRQSLRALRTDYLDLWLIHSPPSSSSGRARMWEALLAARSDGLIRDAGVSNYSLPELDEAAASGGEMPAVNQVDWAPPLFDAGVLAGHADRGVALEGYSGLKNTDLRSPVLAEVAAAHGVSPAQVVLRWHLEHGITVIPKSASPDRIAANLDILDFALTGEQVAAIDAMASPRRRLFRRR